MKARGSRPGIVAAVVTAVIALAGTVHAQTLEGGTLDVASVPKYVTPLVIPPVMNDSGTENDYNIAVRQFEQQILPGGIWATLPGCDGQNCIFPPTTVWSYGPDADVTPTVAPSADSQFNYPAYTFETTKDQEITVDWINDLVKNPDACKASTDRANDPACNFISHIVPVDRTLHWANPEGFPCDEARDNRARMEHRDCSVDPIALESMGIDPNILQVPYDGPVPVVVHVHGAHVAPEADGYPEAWWLPRANNLDGYHEFGTLTNQFGLGRETNVAGTGTGTYVYGNDQPSTTLWFHDHSLGMTRANVYAGPAGFWLIREEDGGETGLVAGTLPAPAPVAGQGVLELNVPDNTVRNEIREIPIVIQGRSFNKDGSLFYPQNRAFFEGLGNGQESGQQGNRNAGLDIQTYGEGDSDIAPIWNPEAFFNVMVVNGVSWPELEVAPAIYRFRLLNGTNSRFLNLGMFRVGKKGKLNAEIPFYQIGAEQSVLPKVVRIETGYATTLPGDGSDVNWDLRACGTKSNASKGCVGAVPAPFVEQAMLMGPAERADVLVDFRGMKDGTVIRMTNTAPDAPFGGFPDIPADPATTGQVMQFRVNAALLGASETDPTGTTPATDPWNVVLSLPDADDKANTNEVFAEKQDLALLEEESLTVCVDFDAVANTITQNKNAILDEDRGVCVIRKDLPGEGNIVAAIPFGPKAAVLGTNGSSGGTAQLWSDPIQQNMTVGATETWELWNHSADAHPIHIHLVKFKVVNRELLDPVTGDATGVVNPASAHESGWKDTVIAYPGEVTRLNATFDLAGLYVWHCHILEHEDNEMMVPFCVGDGPGCSAHGP